MAICAADDTPDRQTINAAAPAIFSTLAVGAVWEANEGPQPGYGNQITGPDHLTGFSQRPPLGAGNVIYAPGALINSTLPGNRLGDMAGTSMAAPMVAGVVALMQEAAQQFGGRYLTTNEVREIMQSTADQIIDGDDEVDNVRNTGQTLPRVNAYRAVQEIRARFTNIAPPPPDNGGGGGGGGGGNMPAVGDANGTIAGAINTPQLTGAPIAAINGEIGIDGMASAIGASDVDLYRVQPSAAGTVFATVGSNTASPADFDAYMRVFDATGQQITFNDDANGTLFPRTSFAVQAGQTYYVAISGLGNDSYNPAVAGSGSAGATGRYALSLQLSNADPNGLISAAVEIDLGNEESPTHFLNGLIGADYGQPVGVSDVDIFRVLAPDDGYLVVDIDTPDVARTDFVDSFLRVFNEQGQEVARSDDDQARTLGGAPLEFDTDPAQNAFFSRAVDGNGVFAGHDTDSFIIVPVTRGQTYYFAVSDYFNSDYNPAVLDGRLESGSGGLYDIIISFETDDTNSTINRAIELGSFWYSI